jgi:FixJ family two-component response regulator
VAGALISVIDDDESMLLALGGLLRLYGFAVKTYTSAEEFIRCGMAETPDCIITDVHLPKLSGIGLKAWLDARSSRIPVIMITAHAEARVQTQAMATGAVCLLKKPFEAELLWDGLRKAAVKCEF